MLTRRELFFKHVAQTSDSPPALEIVSAEGCFVTDVSGKKYLDLISGISVSSLGHNNTEIKNAIHKQIDEHLHLMVYGEYIINSQVELVATLAKHLPEKLQKIYLTNSGAEAVEGAMKLAKRFTGKTGFVSFKDSYHGSTQGALSICGNEKLKSAYRPLLPDHRVIEFNNSDELKSIDPNTAAIFVEPVQGEAGVVPATFQFLKALRKTCDEMNILLVFDEIQTGMGRTGNLFAFEKYNIQPDILLLGKAFGGGMPLGAFISSHEIMNTLTFEPVLGHLTTSGGHPVSCAAAIASLKILTSTNIIAQIKEKEKLFRSLLIHDKIKEVRGEGLLLSIEFDNEMINKKVIQRCFEMGLLTDWFLFSSNCMRIAPPLIITKEEIEMACNIILHYLDTDNGQRTTEN
jgi:acetylornithine/succinyldiaminopimelate/putrescine aminotransferase